MEKELLNLSDEEIYELVLNGSLPQFPVGFWDGINGYHTAIKLVRYLFDVKLKWSISGIKLKVNSDLFEKYKLNFALNKCFHNSYYLAIANAYPELKEWGELQYKEKEYNEYSDSDLINAIINKYKDLNRIPNVSDMNKPSGSTISNRFGGWEKALILAGLKEDIYKNIDFNKYPKEEVIKQLKRYFINNEKLPTKDEILKLYPEGVIKEYFKNISNLINVIKNEYTKEELVDILKEKRQKLGRVPNNKEMIIPQAIVFIREFGSWDNALKEANLT